MYYKYNVRSGVTKVKSKLHKTKVASALSAAGIIAAMSMPLAAMAADSQVVVTPANTQGWSTADTRPGGAVNFVTDNTTPGSPNSGALQLTTDSTTAAKAQYLHGANTPLADVTDLSYYTKQNSASFPEAAASYQIPVELNGDSGFSTLVYEPYQNPTQGTVTPGVWQQWDVDQGLFWSSKTVTCSNGTIAGVAGGPATYTLAQINSICPSAVVVGFGVNVGTFNPSYDVETDLVRFNDTTYNFEPAIAPTDKDSCKNGGWANMNSPTFKNQGDCVSWVEHNVNGHGAPAKNR